MDDKSRHNSILEYGHRTGKFNHYCSIKQILGTSVTERERCQNRAGNRYYFVYFFPKSNH